jgi:NAD(P)-dependent dehydrogenase (short-subunit alcohol dehydrogenase family)
MRLRTSLLIGAAGLAAYALVRRALRRDPAAFFSGKSVVVTGGASGIGLALVSRLREYGARVLVVDLDEDALERLATEVPGVEALELDVAAADGPSALVAAAEERFGGLDVLFSNAGIVWAAPFLSMTDADVLRLIDVNFTMQVRVTRELIPYFHERGGGVIAYTGSLSSYVYSPMHSVYTGTKGGLNGFVAAVRRELEPDSNIQLTIIHPNLTHTDIVSQDLFDEVRKTYWLQTPLQVADAFLRGVADGRREVFVEFTDHAFVGAERYAPAALTYLFRRSLDDEMREKAEAAIPDSKIRRQIERAARPTSSVGSSAPSVSG